MQIYTNLLKYTGFLVALSIVACSTETQTTQPVQPIQPIFSLIPSNKPTLDLTTLVCTPEPIPNPTPKLTPSPLQIVIPSVSPFVVVEHDYQFFDSFDTQGSPSPKLAHILETFNSPRDISSFLQAYPWKDSYDYLSVLSPDEFLIQGYGVCTAFARFWCYALTNLKYKSEFITITPQDLGNGHAVAMWLNNGCYTCASNQSWDSTTN